MRFRGFTASAVVVVLFTSCLAVPSSFGQVATPTEMDARASDPVAMGWMVGAPPPQDKLVRYADGSWFRFPQTRWSFSNVRQLMPTRVVRRGNGPTTMLPRAERTDIDSVTFQPLGRSESMTASRMARVSPT